MTSVRSLAAETTGTSSGTQLVSLAQQCSHAHNAIHPEVACGQKRQWFHSHPTPLSPCSKLFAVPEIENEFTRTLILIRVGIQNKMLEQAKQIFFPNCIWNAGKSRNVAGIVCCINAGGNCFKGNNI
jgi:hypothetical protein